MKKIVKKEARILGIDDSPFDKFKKDKVLVIGTIFRGGQFLDGVLSTKVTVDGSDSTQKLISMINKTKHKPQLQVIMIDGIALGGFNIIDVQKLHKKTKLSVIVVIRRMPDIANIKRILKKIGKENKIKLLEQAGLPVKIGKIYCQLTGITLEKAKQVLKIACTHSYIPEPIRIAHLIASGVVLGESRGKA